MVLGTGSWVPGRRISSRGIKPFSIIVWGKKILRAIFMGCKTIFLEKNVDEVIDQRLKENLRDIWKIFSNCAKLSSALVPTIKNDRSLKMK